MDSDFEKLPHSTRAERVSENELKSKINIIKDREGRVSSVIAIEGKKSFDLSELLPEGTVFVVSDALPGSPFYGFHYRPGNPRSSDDPPMVKFSSRGINSQSGRIGLLHEIGHAIISSPGRRGLFRTISLTIELVEVSPEINKLKTQKDYDAFLVKEFYRQMKERPDPVTEEEISHCINDVIRDEEMAWEAALKLYHKVKDEKGIDLLGGLSEEEISKTANIDLASYRDVYGKFLIKNRD